MVTTFEKFSGTQADPWCVNPKIDVEIIEDAPRVCRNSACKTPVQCVTTPGRMTPEWVHIGESLIEEHWVSVSPTCRYCGVCDPEVVTFHQMAWNDETQCSRCGSVSGYGIGD